MATAIEDTVKALMEFESELDRVKAEVTDSRKKIIRDATEWASNAKSTSISKAQDLASERLAKARSEAEVEAEAIRKKGETSLKTFEGSISKHRAKAAEHVTERLMGKFS
jgi:vacuolar-type H+-ATPase subunit H